MDDKNINYTVGGGFEGKIGYQFRIANFTITPIFRLNLLFLINYSSINSQFNGNLPRIKTLNGGFDFLPSIPIMQRNDILSLYDNFGLKNSYLLLGESIGIEFSYYF